jgi:hypothetical protein
MGAEFDHSLRTAVTGLVEESLSLRRSPVRMSAVHPITDLSNGIGNRPVGWKSAPFAPPLFVSSRRLATGAIVL